MNALDQLASAMTARYGVIKRARGPFLYTAKGVRLTDLYQEGGRAILGWGSSTGTSAFTVLKNVLSRGACGSFDTDFTPRADGSPKNQLAKAVSELLASDRRLFLYSSKNAALTAALALSPDGTAAYRPWLTDADWSKAAAVIIEPPLPLALPLWIVAAADSCAEIKNPQKLPETVHIAAPLAAAVTRSIYDLIKALQEREEKHWFIYDKVLTRYWKRQGPYLYPKMQEAQYADFVQHCLDCRLVISPLYSQPSIVPFGADRGVFRLLEQKPFCYD